MFFRWEAIKAGLKFFRSLRMRIFLLFIIVGTIPSILMRYGILENYENRAVSVRTSEVQTQLKIIANHLITYNYLQDTSSPVINAELEQLSNLYNGRVLIIGNNLKVVKDTYGISEGKIIISEDVVKCLYGESMSDYNEEFGYIKLYPVWEPRTFSLQFQFHYLFHKKICKWKRQKKKLFMELCL